MVYGGHAAVAIGNDNTGWNYYSEDGRDANGNQLTTTKKYSSLSNLENELGKEYVVQNGVRTQPLQDLLMKTWAEGHLKDPYSGAFNNCGDFVMGVLRAGGLHPTANSFGPTTPNNMHLIGDDIRDDFDTENPYLMHEMRDFDSQPHYWAPFRDPSTDSDPSDYPRF